MTINLEFEIGEIVYLKHDPEQEIRMVTGVLFRGKSIEYEVCSGLSLIYSMGFELSRTKNIMI